jgi:Disulphide bond corrector protein DsbC
MKFSISKRFDLLLIFALLFPAAVGSQGPSGKDVVSPEAFASYDPVARGKSFQVAVVMKIRPGFHVNAREVSADYLIPTELRPDVPAGFKASEIIYPKGTLHTFTFSKNKQLNVYTGTIILRLPLTVLPNAPLGSQRVPLKLHYQACSDEICLPPVTLPVDATINVTDNPDSARPAHSDIFPK